MDFIGLLKEAPVGPRLELGVGHGTSLQLVAQHPNRTVGVDAFENLSEIGIILDEKQTGNAADYLTVKLRFGYNPRIQLIKGWFPDVLKELPQIKWSFVHIDLDYHAPTLDAVYWAWPRMQDKGIICCSGWIENSRMFAAQAIKDISKIKKKPDGAFEDKVFWRF
jgi:hypothetical protein